MGPNVLRHASLMAKTIEKCTVDLNFNSYRIAGLRIYSRTGSDTFLMVFSFDFVSIPKLETSHPK